jgi:hypothetical protein
MDGVRHLDPALPLDNVMASATVREVIDSMNPDYACDLVRPTIPL